MKKESTVKDITQKVEKTSTEFEKNNTEIKRKYLVWNIYAFNKIASAVSVNKGSFGTGYPFYALDKDLNGKLPIIQEQIRYNRQLVRDGEQIQKSIWKCESCLKTNYSNMPDLKKICNPCPNMIKKLKPRKVINRLPDLDMWLVCEDGKIEKAEVELSELLKKYNMRASDIDPFLSLEETQKISNLLKKGIQPEISLPMDVHIIEYSKLKELIEEVPETLNISKNEEKTPYLPIYPKSHRKQWQYDDEAYNYIYDFLSAFTEFNFPEELQQSLDNSRLKITEKYKPQELFDFLLKSATESNFRRFQSNELEEYFFKKVEEWKKIKNNNKEFVKEKPINNKEQDDEIII